MGKGSPPSAPDPQQTAAAQGQANREAVEASARYNQIGVNSPYGRQFYTGALGSPDRALNIELTPEGQQALTSQQQLAASLAGFGSESLAPGVMERLSSPDSGRVEDAIYQRGLNRLQPQYDLAEEQLQSRLMGQGIPVGSRAYEQATSQLARQEADAMENLALSSISAGTAEDRAQRSQAINELSALLQGSPAINAPPAYSGAQYQVAPPNIAGLTAQNYGNQMNMYGARAQELGGLYGLAGQVVRGFL